MRRSLMVLAVLGIALIGCGGPRKEAQRSGTDDGQAQRVTVSEIRGLGAAMEGYAVDNNRYPALEDRDMPVSVLKGRLVPTYMHAFPETDGWGRPLFVRGDARGEAYVISSYGADGAKDAAPSQGATTDVNADIVYSAGEFKQYPLGMK